MNKSELNKYQEDFNKRHPGHAEAVVARKRSDAKSKALGKALKNKQK